MNKQEIIAQDQEIKQPLLQTQESDNQQVDILVSQQQEQVNQLKGVNLTWENLSASTTGYAQKGQVLAIMGISGAGKTTLLSLIAKRVQQNKQFRISGQTFFNNEEYNQKQFGKQGAFIQQHDLLRSCLTVRETIYYSARLKLKDSEENIQKLVDKIIKELQLQNCQNTYIGGNLIKGVSGGERKRTCIGLELISDPEVLVLDEPTSGLDSYTAWLVVHNLKQLAIKQNKTIIITIHQPSQDIVELFDRLILMRKGQIIYQGFLSNLNIYAEQIGIKINENMNQIEYFMKLLQLDEQETQFNSQNYQQILQPQVQKEMELLPEGSKYVKKEAVNSVTQEIGILLERQYKNHIRNFRTFWAKIFQVTFTAIFLDALWAGKGNIEYYDQSNMTNYLGNLTGLCYIYNVNILMAIITQVTLNFPTERPIFVKEFNSGYFRIFSYLLVKIIIEIPLLFLSPAILTFLTYFCIDLHPGRYWMTYIILIGGAMVGHGIGFLNGSIFKNERLATGLSMMIVMPMMLIQKSLYFKTYFVSTDLPSA
ncbi:P-loop containing nucleoside triphosphate hydrolase [Pseudocohnilembus persalinus]|uniref:p-loop containing nucleoside triphosphate hydrolase n=1 Tax=Pseudocohnilembus persalinus TaxID=266149 RepID=A0A0V0QLA5_PSEPJ|nr:P-loop containing nucleoside triphosphate hydrolase [Pseudocohnilembus persalinus]|eukprot:KRX03038.1 P-loop containing nucleoside triphosphate hydrolase [Pseudocohnilembus persalinus]